MKWSRVSRVSINALLFIVVSVLSLPLASGERPTVLSIKSGEVRILDIEGVKRVALGNPKIMSYKTLDNGQVMLVGLEAGETSLHIWRNGGRQMKYWVYVEPRYISHDEKLAKALTKNIKGIQVYSMDNRLVVEGKIDKRDVVSIEAIRNLVPDALLLIETRPFSKESIIRVDAVLVEIGTNDMRKLGIEWGSTIDGPTFGFHKTITGNNFFRVFQEDDSNTNEGIINTIPFGDNSFFQYFGITSHLLSSINFLQNAGKARILSSPKLTAVSGQSARVHIGGRFPIPVINAVGAISVEREDYGVVMEVLPTLDDDLINIEVSVDLSDIDPSVTVNGIPGTRNRRTDTVVQLQHNQTVAISGLFSMADSNANGGIPYLSQLPVLKYLFGIDDKDKEDREVVVLLTPRIITPGNEDDRMMSDFARGILREFDAKITIDAALME